MRSERALSLVVTTALLALLAMLCAHWFWQFAAPVNSAPVEPLRADTGGSIEALRSARLFGEPAATPASSAQLRTDLVLRGISASRSGGMAVIALDRNRVVTVKAGEEIAPGIRLERVHGDHVVVVQNGTAQRIELPQRKPVDAAPVAAAGARR